MTPQLDIMAPVDTADDAMDNVMGFQSTAQINAPPANFQLVLFASSLKIEAKPTNKKTISPFRTCETC